MGGMRTAIAGQRRASAHRRSAWQTATAYGNIAHCDPARRNALTAILIAALLCFLWQTIVVQTHFHSQLVPVSAVSGANIAPQVSAPNHQSESDDPANCPICQERAHAGAYLTPEPAVFQVSAEFDNWVGTAPAPGTVAANRSHSWQSRAPPSDFRT